MNSVYEVACYSASPPDLSTSAHGPFIVHAFDTLPELDEHLRLQAADAILLEADGPWPAHRLMQWPGWGHAAADAALVVLAPEPPPALAIRMIQQGAQDVVPSRETRCESLARVLRLSIERKRLELAAREALHTDLATGLPNRLQLQDHMTQLLALRQREPAPMAVLVLRVEDLQDAESRLGLESANVLRRQLAERLRMGLRASDVVATIGTDAFAVLLAWIDAPEDGEQVAAKMTRAAQRPFIVAGRELSLSVGMGVSRFPEQGRQADALLQMAIERAVAAGGLGRSAAMPS